MKKSLSWRITAPLRRVANVILLILRFLLRIPLKTVGPRLDNHPELTQRVIAGLRRFPRVHAILSRSLAATRGLTYSTKQSLENISEIVPRSVPNDFFWNTDGTNWNTSKSDSTILCFVDHTVSTHGNTGIQRVVRRFAAALEDSGAELFFVKWDRERSELVGISFEEATRLTKWNGPRNPNRNRFQNVEFNNAHLMIPEVPYMSIGKHLTILELARWAKSRKISTSAIFYDDIPLRANLGESLKRRHQIYMTQLMELDVVLPSSSYSERNLINFWTSKSRHPNQTLPKIRTLPLAVNSFDEISEQESSSDSKMILCVGTIEVRKNQLTLIAAFNDFVRKSPNDGWTLHLAGHVHPEVSLQFESLLRNSPNVVFHGPVDDEVLQGLYQRCSFVVCSSIEEGFGMPIAESLWFGRPCICANFGAMREVAEIGGCLTVDVRQVGPLTNAIESLCNDQLLRTSLISQIPPRHKLRTWNDFASDYFEAISCRDLPDADLGVVYYFLDSTIRFRRNTGIQRVVRQLASAMLNTGIRMIPVSWDFDEETFRPVPIRDLEFISEWNGPSVESWSHWIEPSEAPENSWFVEAEVPTEHPHEFHSSLLQHAREQGLKTANIFYDAIPVKLGILYPQETSVRHSTYMSQLSSYDLVIPISRHSANDLGSFWREEGQTFKSIEHRIRPIVLAGEFTHTPRVFTPKLEAGSPLKLLMVSTLEPRKNHKTLLESFELAHQVLGGQIELVLVGHHAYPDVVQLVETYMARFPDIRWERSADDVTLQNHYSNCDITVYPSIEEGFGLPILESLWNARPCICANTGSMNEIASDGGVLTTEITNPESLANCIIDLAINKELYSRLANESVSRDFRTWKDYATELVLLLRSRDHSEN